MKKVKKFFFESSPAVKASIALLFANLVLKGLSMISGPIFTRMMSSAEYGVVSTFYSWESLFYTFITLNLASGVFNNGMVEYRKDRDIFEFNLLVVSSLSTIIFFVIYVIFHIYFDRFLELQPILIIMMFINFLLTPAYSYWNARQRYELKYKKLTFVMILMAVLSLVISLLAVVFAGEENKAVARIISGELISCGFGLVFFIFISIKAKFKIKLDYCVYALKFNIPLLPHYMSIYILNSADRVMITKMVNTTATAIYSVAYTAGMAINIVWQSIESSLSPWIYEKLMNDEKVNVKMRTFHILILYSIICFLVTLFAPEVMDILAPKEYQIGIYVIPSVVAGTFFTGIYTLYMRVELYYKNTGFASIATGIAAIVNLITNFIFIKLFGFLAAGYTTMACYFLLYILHYINVKRKGYSDILDNRGIFILTIVYVIITLLIPVLYEFTVVRYILIIVISLIVFGKRKNIIEILNVKYKS